MMIIDLKDFRCPNAQLALTRVLASFNDDSCNQLTILTIEPSLKRALLQRIEHMGYPMQLSQESSSELTQKIILSWGEDVDEDDISDVERQHTLIISKR